MLNNKPFLTREEAMDEASRTGYVNIYSHSDYKTFFYTGDYCWTEGRAQYGVLDLGWVPCSMGLPMTAVPRPGLESGVVTTLEELECIFHEGETFVSSWEELEHHMQTSVKTRREEFHKRSFAFFLE